MSTVQPIQFLADAYASILSDSLALFGARPNVSWTIDTQTVEARRSPGLWWIQPFDTGKGDEVFIGAAATVWTALAGLMVGDGSDPDSHSPQEAYIECIGQTLSDLADALSALALGPIRATGGRQGDSPAELPLLLAMEVQYREQTIGPIWLGCTSSFLSAVHRMLTAQASGGAGRQPDEPAHGRSGQPSKFDMLLDVELSVSVSFGKATLPLKDVLKLAVGSIVELNRKPAEPVDVIVNNCVVARGEVVVVEGSYGLRLLEIVGEQERLSLR